MILVATAVAKHHHIHSTSPAKVLALIGLFLLLAAVAMGMRSIMSDSVTIRPVHPDDGVVTDTVRHMAKMEKASYPVYVGIAKCFLVLGAATLVAAGVVFLAS